MLSVLVVNGGNYLYNLILGRILGPEQFADAAVLITLLLVLSFFAMTFQLVTAKFSVELERNIFVSFVSRVYKYSFFVGLFFGALVIVYSKYLQLLFNTSSSIMFVVFGVGIPLYFLMSVNRGVYQGTNQLKQLSITYQLEMLSRLLVTLSLIYFFNIKSPIVIALGILLSFCFGMLPFKVNIIRFKNNLKLDNSLVKSMRSFFVITAFYELTQIIINNSDILLVKHYFDSYEAGLYASLALIGRIVYFIAWMFVMLLLPTVVQLKKEGKDASKVLFKYVGYITIIASAIVCITFLFPKTAILILFGEDYLSIASLLWKYALSTGIFAISNIFAYYFLSLDKYIPVVLSGFFGLLQVILIVFYHNTLEQVVSVQLVAMFLLLAFQLGYFFFNSKK
ncbi:oligosaccharide flippase family protein [Aurantibacter sp.]|uniref:oligosaccharide flippase family protein n=1 Tax=Aurantibacter sp. TaxID=2807103 RepID=UPI0035C86660